LRAATRRIAVPVAITSGLVLSGAIVWHTSYAAFTSTTSNDTNTLQAGNVDITDTDGGTAMFTSTQLKPGSTDTQCVTVNYNGDLASDVTLTAAYTDGTAASTDLAPYLDFTVEEVDTAGACNVATQVTEFNAAATTLADKVTVMAAPGISLGWTPSSSDTKRYRFTYTLQDDNNAQSKSASVDFTWTATNS